MLNDLEKSFTQFVTAQVITKGDRMTKSSSLAFAIAAVFLLNMGIASAEDQPEVPQVKREVPTHPEDSTNPKKEETADKKPPENDTAKTKEDPNCE
jgi:hypothetical protein